MGKKVTGEAKLVLLVSSMFQNRIWLHTSTGLSSLQESGFNLPTKKSGVQRVQTSPSFSPRKSAIKTEDLEFSRWIWDGMGQMSLVI